MTLAVAVAVAVAKGTGTHTHHITVRQQLSSSQVYETLSVNKCDRFGAIFCINVNALSRRDPARSDPAHIVAVVDTSEHIVSTHVSQMLAITHCNKEKIHQPVKAEAEQKQLYSTRKQRETLALKDNKAEAAVVVQIQIMC